MCFLLFLELQQIFTAPSLNQNSCKDSITEVQGYKKNVCNINKLSFFPKLVIKTSCLRAKGTLHTILTLSSLKQAMQFLFGTAGTQKLECSHSFPVILLYLNCLSSGTFSSSWPGQESFTVRHLILRYISYLTQDTTICFFCCYCVEVEEELQIILCNAFPFFSCSQILGKILNSH